MSGHSRWIVLGVIFDESIEETRPRFVLVVGMEAVGLEESSPLGKDLPGIRCDHLRCFSLEKVEPGVEHRRPIDVLRIEQSPKANGVRRAQATLPVDQSVVKCPDVEWMFFGENVVIEQRATKIGDGVERVSEMFQAEKELVARQPIHLRRSTEIAEEKDFVGIGFNG